jgi:hypothetical protein
MDFSYQRARAAPDMNYQAHVVVHVYLLWLDGAHAFPSLGAGLAHSILLQSGRRFDDLGQDPQSLSESNQFGPITPKYNSYALLSVPGSYACISDQIQTVKMAVGRNLKIVFEYCEFSFAKNIAYPPKITAHVCEV